MLLFRRACLRADRLQAGRIGLAALAAGWLLAAPVPAMAQVKIVDEVKIGALGHDLGFLGHHLEAGPDINVEMLFTPPDVLAIIGSPRPHIGADINTAGNTSDGYLGLFRESAELGYQLTPGINVSALLDHISNANLGRHNMGITSAGARFGFKF